MPGKSTVMVLREFRSPLKRELIDVPPLRPGEVLVKLSAAGVCGSDVHMWRGEDPRTPLPIILGHEGVGEVVEIAGVKRTVDGRELQAGDPVLWNRGITCGKCHFCQVLREPYLCADRLVYGINVSRDTPPFLNGCYSEYLVLRDGTDIFLLPPDADPVAMVSASCSGATVAHAFDLLRSPLQGSTVVVQGPGPLGVYSIAFARAMGADRVAVIGGSADRLEMCGRFGADLLLDRHRMNEEERRAKILEITGGRGADVVVEAVGMKGVAKEGLSLLRKGGIYLSTGYAQPVGTDNIDFYADVVNKNVTVHGVWVSDTRHTWMAINLVLRNPDLFSQLITHRFPLDRANDALAAMHDKTAVKAALVM